jgi:hypothetical protein
LRTSGAAIVTVVERAERVWSNVRAGANPWATETTRAASARTIQEAIDQATAAVFFVQM